MSDIVFSELAGDIRVPTVAVETDLDTGRQGVPSLSKDLLLVGYQTSAGSASVGAINRVTSVQKAIELHGIGSMLAVMVEAALRVSPRIPIYTMPVTESAGVAASQTVTLANNATAVGTLSVWVAGRLFRVGIETGDTPTVIGDALEAAVNAHANLPVTASNSTGTVTFTARQKGIGGNTIAIRSEITASIGTTSTDGAAYLASGTLEGDPTTQLANAEGQRFHIIACWANDPTTVAIFKTHINKQSTATVQKWGFVIAPSCESIASAVTDAATYDAYRVQLVNLYLSDVPEYELCAAFAALRTKEVNRNKTLDYLELTGIPAPYNQTGWPATDDEQTALEGGVAVLRPMRNGGGCQVVRNVHTRVTTPAFYDCEPLEISDYIDEDLISMAKLRFARKSLKVSSPAGTPNVVTPERFLIFLHERMRIWDIELDYTQGAEADIEAGATKAQQNASDTSRLDVGYPFRPVFGLHVIAVRKEFTTPDLFT